MSKLYGVLGNRDKGSAQGSGPDLESGLGCALFDPTGTHWPCTLINFCSNLILVVRIDRKFEVI
jgi:hypothetical protein